MENKVLNFNWFKKQKQFLKTVVVVNRNKDTANRIKGLLGNHTVFTFDNVHEANLFMSHNKPHTVIIPKNLKISRSLVYSDYIKKFHPLSKVVTINSGTDNNFIDLKLTRQKYIESLLPLWKEYTNEI